MSVTINCWIHPWVEIEWNESILHRKDSVERVFNFPSSAMSVHLQLPVAYHQLAFSENGLAPNHVTTDQPQLVQPHTYDRETAKRLLEAYAKDLVDFLDRYDFLQAFQAVDFFTCHRWSSADSASSDLSLILPFEDWSKALDEPFNVDEWCDIVARGFIPARFPDSLKSYLRQAHALALPRQEISVLDVLDCSLKEGDESKGRIPRGMSFGMSDKKKHEVVRLAQLVSQLHLQSDTNSSAGGEKWIVDFGAGQGYLSSLLNQVYGHRVLGVDCDEIQTCGSKSRANRLEKKARKEVGKGNVSMELANLKVPWLHTTRRIQEQDLGALFKDLVSNENQLSVEDKRLTICGLHACGDLSACMVQCFVHNPSVEVLVNASCCYHLLTTNKHQSESKSGPPVGFPLSSYIQTVHSHFHLNKRARNLASQSTWRWGTSSQPIKEVELMFKKHFYRAVLQVLLIRKGLLKEGLSRKDIYFGKLPDRSYDSFESFVRMSFERIGVGLYDPDLPNEDRIATQNWGGKVRKSEYLPDQVELGSAEIRETFLQYSESGYQRLAAAWSLRSMVSGAVESLILVDRVLFLVEQKEIYPQILLMPLFDHHQSPRNMVLLASRCSNK